MEMVINIWDEAMEFGVIEDKIWQELMRHLELSAS